jgi:hypothetical protein
MAAEVWERIRPKGRPPVWAFRVTSGDVVVFESAWVAVRFSTRSDAVWLASLVDRLVAHGRPPARPGTTNLAGVRWNGDLADDCWTTVGNIDAHAEHLYGPRRGGAWYCSVGRQGESLFHTADIGIQPRSSVAARWMCELVMSAAELTDAR